MNVSDTAFTGSIPGNYDRYLGPLLFEAYAEETARRAAALAPSRILEIAAGTGIVTAAMHRAVPGVEIVATDLNPAMLEVAAGKVSDGTIEFRPADALDLPFGDGEFDLVVSQFGVMFYPDKPRAHSEARRVLRDGGTYLAVIWDRLDRNPVSHMLEEALAAEFPDDPPRFLERTPFGYADQDVIVRDLSSGGFETVRVETVALSSKLNAREAAYGMCAGSPMTAEIAERGEDAVDRAQRAAERALAPHDGTMMPMSALYATATR